VNYAKLLEVNSFFTLHSFLKVGKTHDLPSKFWQTLGDAARGYRREVGVSCTSFYPVDADACVYS
jgi:hypothetical protein